MLQPRLYKRDVVEAARMSAKHLQQLFFVRPGVVWDSSKHFLVCQTYIQFQSFALYRFARVVSHGVALHENDATSNLGDKTLATRIACVTE